MTSSGQEYHYPDDVRTRAATWMQQAETLPSTSRRRKLAGYLKAANELRQSYQDTAVQTWRDRNVDHEYDDEAGEGIPGAFPDAAVVRSGDEQMVLFPSYARRHVRKKPRARPGTIQQASGTGRDVRDSAGTGDAEFWRQEWEKYEDDHAIVDVDVRGWLYAPHRGGLNRKQRLFVSLARQLAGLPNQNQQASTSSGQPPSGRERLEARAARHDDEKVAKEAENILRKGEAEADIAAHGGYSERPERDTDVDSLRSYSSRTSVSSSRKPSTADPSPLSQVTTVDGQGDGDTRIRPIQKRASWNQPAEMSSAELATANSHLMTRLRPFLANPTANTAISAFFYNEDNSQQRTIHTDNYGHFSLRAPLEFVPTHVRILASEDLSATEEVIITETRGISLISDIDDTIKHSAIGSGAREIFRNAFIRELQDLTIEGVKEWYDRLFKMGVKFHYVSNSPWQLYPVLTKYFALAGLPPGSFHLKQYSGMLQGIFEPVAERKKLTLEKLAHDFPERAFILVGDSGEADLEVYTDFVLEHPGRVLGIFIRDVTTNPSQAFFSSANPVSANVSPGQSPGRSPRRTPNMSPRLGPVRDYSSNGSPRSSVARNSVSTNGDDDDAALQAGIRASLKEFEEFERKENEQAARGTVRRPVPEHTVRSDDETSQRPHLPSRQTQPAAPQAHQIDSDIGDLIEFSDDEAPAPKPSETLKPTKSTPSKPPSVGKKPSSLSTAGNRRNPPMPAKKPVALAGVSPQDYTKSSQVQGNNNEGLKTPPPKPRRPSTSVRSPSSPSVMSNEDSGTSVATTVGQKLSSAYNALPSMPVHLPGSAAANSTSAPAKKPPAPAPRTQAQRDGKPGPPPPPRRTVTSYPAAAANYAGNRLSDLYHYNDPVAPSISQTQSYTTRTSNASLASNASLTRTNTASSTNSNLRPDAAGLPGSFRNEYWEQQPQMNKKEALWRQRWLQASHLMRDKGVVLKSWRVGEDVESETVKLVEEALQREKEGRGIKPKKKYRGSSLEQ